MNAWAISAPESCGLNLVTLRREEEEKCAKKQQVLDIISHYFPADLRETKRPRVSLYSALAQQH